MVRHFQTAQILAREVSYENGVVQDPLWNDCELTLLWDALAPALKLRDPDFAAAVASERHSTPDHRVSVSDLALVDAWLSGRAVSDVVPAWDVFRIGVETALEQLFARGDDESVLVVTSSKPIAAICLKVLGLPVTAFAGLASSFYNASVTIVSGSSSGLQSVLAMNENYFRSASLRTLR
jgi:broad specificity phosphatase PhoE